jgi:hypothetical protein
MIDVNTIDWNEAWKKPEGEEGKRRVLSVVGDDGQILIDANGLTMS